MVVGVNPGPKAPGQGVEGQGFLFLLMLLNVKFLDQVVIAILISVLFFARSAPAEMPSMESSLHKGKALYRIISRSPAWNQLADDFRRFSGASIERGSELLRRTRTL